jgi:PadR family transcriptional regulator, regulatory protein PadR
MSSTRKHSPQTIAVMVALSHRPSDWLYGLELSKLTGLKSGSLYPILIRLADRGLLESRWLDPTEPGRPPRHAYRLTLDGLKVVSEQQSPVSEMMKEART